MANNEGRINGALERIARGYTRAKADWKADRRNLFKDCLLYTSMEICAPSRAHRAFASLCCEKTAVLHAPNRAQRLSRTHRPCCATGWPASPDRRVRRTSRATCASTRDRPWGFARRAAHRAFTFLCCEKTAVLHAPNRAHRGFRARTGRANNPVDSTAIGVAFCARASRRCV